MIDHASVRAGIPMMDHASVRAGIPIMDHASVRAGTSVLGVVSKHRNIKISTSFSLFYRLFLKLLKTTIHYKIAISVIIFKILNIILVVPGKNAKIRVKLRLCKM